MEKISVVLSTAFRYSSTSLSIVFPVPFKVYVSKTMPGSVRIEQAGLDTSEIVIILPKMPSKYITPARVLRLFEAVVLDFPSPSPHPSVFVASRDLFKRSGVRDKVLQSLEMDASLFKEIIVKYLELWPSRVVKIIKEVYYEKT